jgi:ATP-dependent RNA helicase RhlE
MLLREILKQYPGSVLLFVRTRRAAEHVARLLREKKYSVAEIHSDRSMGQRKEALRGFKTGEFRILVATDIAARGIDVSGIELVINYDIPDDPENYVHRIGRTGRAGIEGHAISFATPDQQGDIKKIESIVKTAIPISNHPSIPKEDFRPTFSSSKVRSFLPPGFRRSRIARRGR